MALLHLRKKRKHRHLVLPFRLGREQHGEYHHDVPVRHYIGVVQEQRDDKGGNNDTAMISFSSAIIYYFLGQYSGNVTLMDVMMNLPLALLLDTRFVIGHNQDSRWACSFA